MNFHIVRIRLASVGPEPARYDPLDLPLTNADGTGPADTVLFLSNAGGKTVLLRLLFSVLHPSQVERIGTEETARKVKNLPGYVLERDTSHVALEWRKAEAGQFVDDEVTVTGLVAEWPGGRPTATAADLKRVWYSIRGPVNSVGVGLLPFDDVQEADGRVVKRRRLLSDFVAYLDELERNGRRQGISVSYTETQKTWVDHLDAIGFDRALFRYQVDMNHNEAGASAIARFTEDKDFVEFFLKTVFDPTELAALDRQFEEVSIKSRRYPEYERRVRFEQQALKELEQLAALVEQARQAADKAQSVRTEALALAGSVSAASTRAAETKQTETERWRQREKDSKRHAAEVDRLRDEMRGFKRIAAQFARDEAAAALERAKTQKQSAELEQRAWSAVTDLAELKEAIARAKVLEEQYRQEEQRRRPLQDQRDEAARALVAQLVASAVIGEADAAAYSRRADEARRLGNGAREEALQKATEAAHVDAEREAAEKRVQEVGRLRDQMVARGVVQEAETAADARDRHQQQATQARQRSIDLMNELDALEEEGKTLTEQDHAQSEIATQLRLNLHELSTAIKSAEQERQALVTNSLVADAAEAETFDLELVGSAIAERLLGRAQKADEDRLRLAMRAVDDERALRALANDGLLPPSADVETALTSLASAGIVRAIPGARYVADAVAKDKRTRVLENRADLVAGIVLTDSADVDRARVVLNRADLRLTSVIAVGPSSEIADAEEDGRARQSFVIPPTDAIWDRDAAADERRRREERQATVDRQREELDGQERAARSVAQRLTDHISNYPAGWLRANCAERDRLANEADRLAEEALIRRNRQAAIRLRRSDLHREQTDVADRLRHAEQAVQSAHQLLEAEVGIAHEQTGIERLREKATTLRRTATERSEAALNYDIEAHAAFRAATEIRTASAGIRKEASAISLATRMDEPSLEEATSCLTSGDDLAELRVRYEELDQRLRRELSESEVSAKLDEAIRSRDRLHRRVDDLAVEVRVRAEALLNSAEGADEHGRSSALRRAEEVVARSLDVLTAAAAEYKIADDELKAVDDENNRQKRSIKIPDDRLPGDRTEALRLEAEARQKSEDEQAKVTAANDDAAKAKAAASEADVAERTFRALERQLRAALRVAEHEPVPSGSVYSGDIADATTEANDVTARLSEAVSDEDKAKRACSKRDDAIRALLGEAEFAELAGSDKLYRRLMQSTAEALARDAADLVNELRAAIAILQAELATMADDIRLATTSLAKSVIRTSSLLRSAETRSKMPGSLRDWAGQSFLTVDFQKVPAEEVEARLQTLVADIVKAEHRPTGTKLLLMALDRAVGAITVQILKPNEAFAPIRVPVAELSTPKFSNGQRSTVATALMLMLSELRRQTRSSAKGASVGTLLLDNPFGNANAGFLIDVQRTVAAAAGIQLVYTTGIADLNALRHFPNVIALSNDMARRTMRRYVRANPEFLKILIPTDESPGGRVSAARVMVTRRESAED